MYGFNQPYVRDKTRMSFPVYMPGETYSFIMNSNIVIDDPDIETFELRILDVNDNVLDSLGQVNKVYISGTSVYQMYKNLFVFPSLKDGYYYFQIFNSTLEVEVFRSNLIYCSSNCLWNTSYVEFRHNTQLFGVRYDLLPGFYQKFRLPINQVKSPNVRSDREQNRDSSNGRLLRNTKSFRDIIINLEYYFATDEEMEALSAMLEHNEIYINYNKVSCQLSQAKIDKPSDFSKLSKATFEVIIDRTTIDYSSLDNYGDFIAFGGNFFTEIYETIYGSDPDL